ncbi:MAG: hypothetical protein JXQ67_10635 [Campylobacterales bacterium]|nr:hypothetical protein [Campylobacterales bacterium]
MRNTKSREFVISTETLSVEYDYLLDANMLEEYVFEELEIPKECIKSLNISEESLNIKLLPTRTYFNDDWYVNLLRVS